VLCVCTLCIEEASMECRVYTVYGELEEISPQLCPHFNILWVGLFSVF